MTTRRDLITLLGAAAVVGPRGAWAQQAAMPVVGFLHTGSPAAFSHLAEAFREGIKSTGFIDGQNLSIEYRWAEGRIDQLPQLANELVGRRVAIIAATGGNPSGLAAKSATATIPIVFQAGSDPVEAGFVSSLSRPTGNITGVSIISPELVAKRLEVLHEALPTARKFAFLVYPKSVKAEQETREVEAAARALNHEVHAVKVSDDRELEAAFTSFARERDPSQAAAVQGDRYR